MHMVVTAVLWCCLVVQKKKSLEQNYINILIFYTQIDNIVFFINKQDYRLLLTC